MENLLPDCNHLSISLLKMQSFSNKYDVIHLLLLKTT